MHKEEPKVKRGEKINPGPEIIAVVGPTACGKTRRAVSIAKTIGGEIISGDSRQVYKGMDIGTGKDLCEYGGVRHHLIDIVEAGEKYNLHRFLADFHDSKIEIEERGKMPVLCGGTGMYVEAALSGLVMPKVERNEKLRASLDGKSLEELTAILKTYKSLHNTTDVDTRDRALRAIEIQQYYTDHPEEAVAADRSTAKPLNSLVIGIDIPRDARREKISRRLDARIEEGMIDEIKGLLARGIKAEDLIYYGLEYKFVTLHAIGELSLDDMRRQLEIAIHQFAKRQMTWFRGMEKRGIPIRWLPYNIPENEFIDIVKTWIEEFPGGAKENN
ncbi:MAG: tRNA (adenosine(37)-N6)-dimethylallyltransferase MiaA [Muribaculaceae bacterium]|nr:tRNA (adenosine(37)-N6)-dimethylallyltransferase MiaA [Muribaculaceae bacterium]